MTATSILSLFLIVKIVQHGIEKTLAWLNYSFTKDPSRLKHAREKLSISEDNLNKTINYTKDRYFFSTWSGWIGIIASLVFIALGGLGLIEKSARNFSDSTLAQESSFYTPGCIKLPRRAALLMDLYF